MAFGTSAGPRRIAAARMLANGNLIGRREMQRMYRRIGYAHGDCRAKVRQIAARSNRDSVGEPIKFLGDPFGRDFVFCFEAVAMFENRIGELFGFMNSPSMPPSASAAAPAAQFLPVASLAEIYQAAAARARYDHELDRLFNPDYYGDQGSGI
jgi:hypothetical protein